MGVWPCFLLRILISYLTVSKTLIFLIFTCTNTDILFVTVSETADSVIPDHQQEEDLIDYEESEEITVTGNTNSQSVFFI